MHMANPIAHACIRTARSVPTLAHFPSRCFSLPHPLQKPIAGPAYLGQLQTFVADRKAESFAAITAVARPARIRRHVEACVRRDASGRWGVVLEPAARMHKLFTQEYLRHGVLLPLSRCSSLLHRPCCTQAPKLSMHHQHCGLVLEKGSLSGSADLTERLFLRCVYGRSAMCHANSACRRMCTAVPMAKIGVVCMHFDSCSMPKKANRLVVYMYHAHASRGVDNLPYVHACMHAHRHSQPQGWHRLQTRREAAQNIRPAHQHCRLPAKNVRSQI